MTSAWLTARIEAGDSAAKVVAEFVFGELLDTVGVGVAGQRVGRGQLDPGRQVACRGGSRMAITSESSRLRALLEITSHGLRP